MLRMNSRLSMMNADYIVQERERELDRQDEELTNLCSIYLANSPPRASTLIECQTEGAPRAPLGYPEATRLSRDRRQALRDMVEDLIMSPAYMVNQLVHTRQELGRVVLLF
jgi:hypothetical protein